MLQTIRRDKWTSRCQKMRFGNSGMSALSALDGINISRFQPVADLFIEDFPFAGSPVQSVDCPNTSKSKIH
jgi:hypothetical protein